MRGVAVVLSVVLLAGCRGAAPVAPSGGALAFPPPRDPGRTAATASHRYFKPGASYADDQPLNRVVRSGTRGEYAPAGGAALADLAYATYVFDTTGFISTEQIGFVWAAPPVDYADWFIGLANFTEGHWDFFAGPLDDVLAGLNFADYTAPSGALLLLVVLDGTAPASLGGIYLGAMADPHRPVAELQALPPEGAALLDVTLDAAASFDPDGPALAEYEWDFDGDGEYDASTPAAAVQHTYGQGTYEPAVRVTDSEGKTATVSVELTVTPGAGEWSHTWAVPDQFNEGHALAVDEAGNLYVAGMTSPLSSIHGLLLKFNPAGQLLWARQWTHPGGYDTRFLEVRAQGDRLYVAAELSHLFGDPSEYAVLCLDLDGTLQWQRVTEAVLSFGDYNPGFDVTEDAVWLGISEVFDQRGLVYRLGLDGSNQLARQLGGVGHLNALEASAAGAVLCGVKGLGDSILVMRMDTTGDVVDAARLVPAQVGSVLGRGICERGSSVFVLGSQSQAALWFKLDAAFNLLAQHSYSAPQQVSGDGQFNVQWDAAGGLHATAAGYCLQLDSDGALLGLAALNGVLPMAFERHGPDYRITGNVFGLETAQWQAPEVESDTFSFSIEELNVTDSVTVGLAPVSGQWVDAAGSLDQRDGTTNLVVLSRRDFGAP